MFGYILPEKPELKIREYELFRAFYCGVCKSIGKRYGQIPRLTLNYDSTFLALLLSSISDNNPEVKREGCIAHPVKKRSIIKNNKIIDYASDMNIVLAYYNMRDNWNDDKSLLSGTGALVLKGAFKKICRKYQKKCDIIETKLRELTNLEKEKCNSMDKAAECFAKLMEEILVNPALCRNDNDINILKWIGYNIGKWIYILDAYDDLADDIKKKSYNPLIYQYGYSNESVDDFKARIKERVEFNLVSALNQISKAYELMETKINSGIIENIIYMGMLRKTEQILEVRSCHKIEKSV